MRGSLRTLSTAFAITMAAVALGASAAQAGFKVLHSFGEARRDGLNPSGALVADQAGNLFGTTANGGNNFGTVFELERNAGGGFRYKELYRFCPHNLCQNGRNPTGALIVDVNGNLYGTATNLVFELSPVIGQKRWSEKVLYRFCSQQNCADGDNPIGGLTYVGASGGQRYDGSSPLYGATKTGGINNQGAVFQLTTNGAGWSQDVLYSFCSQGGGSCTDGKLPYGGVLADESGKIYGTTVYGGSTSRANGGGVVFELSQSGGTWNETVLYKFCARESCKDGYGPVGDLTRDAQGNLLGVTAAGGRSCSPHLEGCGVVFQLIPNGENSQETVLYAFCKKRDCIDGDAPGAGVLIGAAGELYGTTQYGGGNDLDFHKWGAGVVFKLSQSSLKPLHKFCSSPGCSDGIQPISALSTDSSFSLYGTTEFGGANGSTTTGGTVFRVTPKLMSQ